MENCVIGAMLAAKSNIPTTVWVTAAVIGAVALFVVVAGLRFLGWQIRAKSGMTGIGPTDIVGMYFRGAPIDVIIQCLTDLRRAGHSSVTARELEAHAAAHGNARAVADAYLRASEHDLPVDFSTLCGIDLAGRDVKQAVEDAITPRPLIVPAAHPNQPADEAAVEATTKDGARLAAQIKMLVRLDLNRLIGGMPQETLVARATELILRDLRTTTDSAMLLEFPDRLVKTLLAEQIDAGAAWIIVQADATVHRLD